MDKKQRVDLKSSLELMKLLKNSEHKNLKDISVELSLSKSTVKRMIKKLQHIGVIIENTGSRRKPSYHITHWGIVNKDHFRHEAINLNTVTLESQ